jgi:hypothetical protein
LYGGDGRFQTGEQIMRNGRFPLAINQTFLESCKMTVLLKISD